jgi:hypothetical protein
MPSVPRVGQFGTVRNRRGVVTAVTPHDGPTGRSHLVEIDYKDNSQPTSERLIWELEPYSDLLEPTALPNFATSGPMPPDDFDAVVRAARWTALSPFLDPDGEGPVDRLPVSSPFHGAVQVEDYQLVPLLKALRMPRVNLLIADDVGLGKTIEAGLIMSELLLRRRIQRVLILTPASLRTQWRDEMWEKFSLSFDLVDRAETHKLRKKLGMDANPWRSFSRIIASYHYLRQDDVLEQFMAASRTPEGSPHLPWDLLIVDECHNLMPSPFGDDSDLCKMLRLLAPQFEHKLFLSATPHNGHTRCFTGLLEILDPVRFSQTSELKPAERERVKQIVMRRLKREINERTNPPKFCTRRPPEPILLDFVPEETVLNDAFSEFRAGVKKLIAEGSKSRRRAGSFAVEILNKRLLSSPTAFAESWRRAKEGLAAEEAATDAELSAAAGTAERDTGDDRETQKREDTAASVTGAWLKAVADRLEEPIRNIDQALAGIGLDISNDDVIEQDPRADARFNALLHVIDRLLLNNGEWRDDERLIVFTEYKTTLDYLVRRLRERFDSERIRMLFGGMDDFERGTVKDAFNDPAAEVRLLLATDAAAEGLNLQRTARYLLHYDCPWNPSRLEQRNGRLDRHGQGRDVAVHYFMSDQDNDLKFLGHIISKADGIREDLSSANELFDEAVHRRLVQGEDLHAVQRDLDARLKLTQDAAKMDADAEIETGTDGGIDRDLEAIAAEVDLDPESLKETLEAAMAFQAGRPQLDCSEEQKTCAVIRPDLPGWADTVDESLRKRQTGTQLGPVSRIAFNPDPFMVEIGGRKVFSPRPDVLLMHLSHPMFQKALSVLTRCRFPGAGEAASRWAVRQGGVPAGAQAVVQVSLEELAVNDLRESFHHWVRTVEFPVRDGRLGEPLDHRPARALRGAARVNDEANLGVAGDVLDDVAEQIKAFLESHRNALTEDLRAQLNADGTQARKQEDERYRSRQGEVSSLIAENTLAKLEREVKELKVKRSKGELFNEAERLDSIDKSIEEKQAEIERRRRHYEEVRAQLEKERERILNDLLPRRHSMSEDAQVFPVALEVRLPGGAS